jgi:hypothetical protein
MGIAVSTLFLSHIPSEKLVGKPVVITGCDTGFGYELSLKLVSRGLTVYSGCYTEGGTCPISLSPYDLLNPTILTKLHYNFVKVARISRPK